ncbi:MAG TPA: TetR/AcrR family transcriptional regulator [Terriglobales bacterium]|nr:TetR/AcrR family transcriptional regulator [Terriglobales bacterium]
MARPKGFDDTAVLEAAVECFWNRGFVATSVRDLGDRMGIGSASLYNAFGDKRTLYAKALEHYLNNSVRERIARLEEQQAPIDAIRAFFAEIIERSLKDPDRRGCMLVNAALEVAAHDADLRAAIVRYLEEIRLFFERSVRAAQKERTVLGQRSSRDVSRLLLGVLLGIRVLARSKPDRALLEGVVRPALSLLD